MFLVVSCNTILRQFLSGSKIDNNEQTEQSKTELHENQIQQVIKKCSFSIKKINESTYKKQKNMLLI